MVIAEWKPVYLMNILSSKVFTSKRLVLNLRTITGLTTKVCLYASNLIESNGNKAVSYRIFDMIP